MKITKFLLLLFVVLFTITENQNAQNVVKIDPSIKRYIGEVSELDRSIYFNMHANWADNSITTDEFNYYTGELNAGFGRSFWGPFSWAKNNKGEVGIYPDEAESQTKGASSVNSSKNSSTWWRRSNRHIATEHPENVLRWSIDTAYAAQWAANYFKYFFNDESRPEFFELMNEPFVHAGDAVFKAEQPDADLMRRKMAEWYAAVGHRIHKTSGLENMKVIGYSSAWPSVELYDFGHWESRQKMFMDVAGEWMDAFSIHLYDGINVTGADSRRSGSNSEAILDLVETYSHLKWGKVKPFAISEFGGIESGYEGYSDTRSIQSIKSMNHLLFNLLEREDNMLIAIPFIGSKATWHINEANNYEPYGSVLWRPKEIGVPLDANTEWVFTPRVHFFELWENVKGSRVYIESNNPDVQLQAFVDANKLYIVLDNLDELNQNVQINLVGVEPQLTGVVKKSLKIWRDQPPLYLEENMQSVPTSISLIPSETVVFECSYDSNIQFTRNIKSKKYYTSTYLQSIQGITQSYQFSGIETSVEGLAYIRMSIGRKHEKSKKPMIKVNGTSVNVPDNWAGGGQINRDDFFGMIQVPVPISLIQSNTTVQITFPDTEGRVASVVLQVEKLGLGTSAEKAIRDNDIRVFPNPVCSNLFIKGLDFDTEFTIVDMHGKTAQHGKIEQKQPISVEGLPVGTYILNLGEGISFQFIKQ